MHNYFTEMMTELIVGVSFSLVSLYIVYWTVSRGVIRP